MKLLLVLIVVANWSGIGGMSAADNRTAREMVDILNEMLDFDDFDKWIESDAADMAETMPDLMNGTFDDISNQLAELLNVTLNETDSAIFLNESLPGELELGILDDLPPNYDNVSAQVENINGTLVQTNTSIHKESHNGTYTNVVVQKGQTGDGWIIIKALMEVGSDTTVTTAAEEYSTTEADDYSTTTVEKTDDIMYFRSFP